VCSGRWASRWRGCWRDRRRPRGRVVAGQAQHGRRAGVYDHGLVDLARFAHANGLVVRSSNTWTWARPTAGAWTTSSPPPRSSAASTPSCPLGAAHRAQQPHPALVGLPAWIVPTLAHQLAPDPRRFPGRSCDPAPARQARKPVVTWSSGSRDHLPAASSAWICGRPWPTSQAATATPLAAITAGRRRWRGARRRTAQRSGAGVRSAWPPRR
jgi:hypothetical protein